MLPWHNPECYGQVHEHNEPAHWPLLSDECGLGRDKTTLGKEDDAVPTTAHQVGRSGYRGGDRPLVISRDITQAGQSAAHAINPLDGTTPCALKNACKYSVLPATNMLCDRKKDCSQVVMVVFLAYTGSW